MPLGSIGKFFVSLTPVEGVGAVPPDWGGRWFTTLYGAPVPAPEPTRWPTYKTRPVFQWSIDWATTPYVRAEVQIEEVKAGFGDVLFWRDQTNIIHGWEFGCPLAGAEVADCEDFFAELHGRRAGFWVQTPLQAFRVVEGISTSLMRAVDRNTEDSWNMLPEMHVAFTKPGEATMHAQVTNVVDNGDGTERITVTPNLDTVPDSTWQVWCLAYVRLAEDTERASFEGENSAYRTLKVVELPNEYAGFEFGERPVFLYEFTAGTSTWRLTSFGLDVDDGTHVWSRSVMTHGAIRRSIDVARFEVELTGTLDASSPLYQLSPPALALPLWLTIYETTLADPAAKTVLFTGQVVGPVEVDGKAIRAKVASILDIGQGQVPSLIFQPRCCYRVYQPDTCRLSEAANEVLVTITSIASRTVTVTGAGLSGRGIDYFAEGFLECGTGYQLERRTILTATAESGGSVVLTLNMPLYFAGLGDSARVLPGCDGLPDTCIVKFGNFENFGGHRAAFRNLAIKGLATPVTDASKK